MLVRFIVFNIIHKICEIVILSVLCRASSRKMPTTPLKIDIFDDGVRPRDWQPRRSQYKVPLRLFRLCLLGMFLPAVLVAGPMYLRYRVYSEQLYPLTVSDQRLIDAKVSTLGVRVR